MKNKHYILLSVISKKRDKNELICRRETDSQTLKKLWLPKETDREWEGGTGGLGLAYAHWGIWNDWPMGTCTRALRTLASILWYSMGEKIWKRMDVCICMTGSLCCTAEVITAL